VGADAARVRPIYYGSDPERFRPATPRERGDARQRQGVPDVPVAAFIGALGDRRKGFDTAFEAWRRAGAQGWGGILLVIGAGSERVRWERRVAQAGLGDRIRFMGFTPAVRDILWACDLIIAPTRYEAYGLAVHEAVSCGLPAVVSASAGVAERLGGPLRQLLLGDPDDAAELADALLRWAAAPGQYAAAAHEASTALRAWTWADMSAAVLAVLDESRVRAG
jgi:glycosyltransferase involved in cell wall biosynthesis